MTNSIEREVNIRIQMLNSAKTRAEVDRLTEELDHLRRTVDLTEAAERRLTQTQVRANRELANGTRALRADSQALKAEQKALDGAARSQRAVAQATDHTASSLPRLRYALYDVSTTATIAGVALLGLAAATLGASIKMDRDFADVVRTTGTYLDKTGQQTAALRDEFNSLFASLPASWSDLTDIGTLAGQLGVASENVAEFTSLVSKFSTVTGVGVEESATAFGRLSELLNVSATEYENLGSSILATGVSSVATESQIINISSQIASMGSFAGFSADEVIGLSASLASLGVQPELSRGVITRLFTNISVAIADGGTRLEAFGKLTGKTGQEFATAWGDNASGALQEFLAGLGAVDAEGGNSIATLKELGITASRDIPTLLKLAQNSELVAEQFGIANKGYKDGTAIQDQYAVVAETVASKLLVLKNNFQLFVSTLGASSGALGGVVDLLIRMLQVATDIANNPFSAALMGGVIAATALAGAILLTTGAMARFGASSAAIKTAHIELIKLAVTMGVVQTEAQAASMSITRLGAATGVAAAGTRGLTLALRSLKIASVIGIATVAVDLLYEAFQNTSEASDELANSFKQALESDTLSGEGVRTVAGNLDNYQETVETVTLTQQAWNRILAGASTYVEEMARAVRGATGDIDELNLSIGEATITEFMKTFTDDADLREAYQNGLIPSDLDFRTLAEEWAKGGDQAAFAYIDSLYKPDELKAAVERQKALVQEAERQFSLKSEGLGFDESQALPEFDIYWEQAQALAVLEQRLSSYNEVVGIVDDNTSSFAKALNLASFAQRVQGEETQTAAQIAAQSAEDYDSLVEAVDATIASYTEAIELSLGVESALSTLGSSLRDGGLDWSQYSEAGRENIGNILSVMDSLAAETPSDASTIASNFQALYDMLINGGYATAQQLDFIRQAIQGLKTDGAQITNTGRDFSSFFNGWSTGAEKAKKSTASARKEVRTLLDYASDLAKVWDRAFDIRFNSQSTMDTITSTFADMKDAADESAQAIADLNREISGLAVDISTQEYFLSIAINYGDTLRAAEIQRDISDLQAEMADKQADLTDEQAKNSKVLTGNSKAAITNRKQMTDLVGEYEDHIKALAESGMSSADLASATAQLRQQFIAQTTALGYASDEVAFYARAFDDVALAIQRVPRNITVTANADPAIQALNEFEAKLQSVRASAGQGIELPAITNPSNGKELRRRMLEAQALALEVQLRAANINNDAMGARTIGLAIRDVRQMLATGNYYDGGYTGSGGKYEPAGVVHRGEYVVPKYGVDQRTGLPKPDYIGNLSRSASNAPSYASGGYVRGMGYNEPMRLSAGTIQQLAQVLQTRLYLDGQVVAQAGNRNNQQTTRVGAY